MAPDYNVYTKGPATKEIWEFIITHILTFMFIVLFVVPFKLYFIYILWNLRQLYALVGIFLQPLCIGHKIIGLYRAAHEAGKFQVPVPRTQEKKFKRHQIRLLSVSPPRDVYFKENQARHTVIIHNDSLPVPLITTQPERKEVPTPLIRQELTTQAIPTVDTNISQVTPLLGTTPRETSQLQNTNTQEDVEEILGTTAFQRYVETPIQTLDGIIVTQPKRFLPLAQEARKIAEEIRIEKINEQWAGLPQEQLLNQSFNDQLNSIQILKQLAPLQLAKDHLPGYIIDIPERLGKADNIPHNQLYYIAENCVDLYYSKVIETFTLLLK